MDKISTEDAICDSDSTDSQPFHTDSCVSENESSLSAQVDFTDICRDRKTNYRSTQSSYRPYQPPLGLPSGYSPQTPFPSQTEVCLSTLEPHNGDLLHSSSVGSSSVEYPSGNLPSCLVSGNYCSYRGDSSYSSSPDRHSLGEGSLEQPRSLHSIPTAFAPHSYCMPPQPCASRGPPCCSQYPLDVYQMDHGFHYRPHYHMPSWPSRLENSRQSPSEFTHSGQTSPHPRAKLTPSTAPLSLEQRKVFVTYEADSEKHVKEIINFVALLRHNGFYTHIDMFEQQFKSISKIDFMERYISEKDYLIIIVISPKYHETVTNASFYMENDETLNTVYIHKQLQNEFIQNGARNYRFIPILFPGAKKCHVPSWLQSTQIFTWPRDRDDILRRLMRVEKYNPPPIGELPTIVSIPI
ncbi:E3 ubiquitin ligase TRAF3IP2 isoform X2 [Megalobrama amblycephala]|nr:E3 ubiquitin ligase TRAF3IP2 isoform X2 [Megalobrama amblycephala]XP_048055226.1 E3 ubiquitin ligase TRAF3IP2 isoform X2 [Megalobrama amblycephala]XP_048055227.1 E3 ubiquitin ligase TRAF3IP2 isoform X2 [Megalobrama amblycephala]